MSTCSKRFIIYLKIFSCLSLVLSTENCTSQNTFVDKILRNGIFPNPQFDISECGRNCTKSWICDPEHIISTENAEELDTLVEAVATSGTCSCSNCTDKDGHNIGVVLVPSSKVYNGMKAGEFASFLLKYWNTQKCTNNIVIVLSRDDKKVYTETGSYTGETLTTNCVEEVHDKIKYKLEDGDFYYVLKKMIQQYKIILSVGNCDYIAESRTRTIAAITTGASFGLAVLLFSFVALIRCRKDGMCEKTSKDGKKYVADNKNNQNSRPCYHSNHSYEGHKGDDEEHD